MSKAADSDFTTFSQRAVSSIGLVQLFGRQHAESARFRDMLDRILASYEEIDRRFAAAGGVGSLLNLYEQVRRELERVSFDELDRMTLEIKSVIEALLKMDYELRKVHNLKLAFETRPAGSAVK